MSRWWWAAASLCLVYLVVQTMLSDGGVARAWLARGVGFVCTAATLVLTSRHTGRMRTVWALLVGYLLLTTIGDVLFDYVRLTTNEVPGTGPADIAYLSRYVFAIAALALLIRIINPSQGLDVWIDSAVISLTLFAATGLFVVGPILGGASGVEWETVVWVAYPVCDVLIVAGLIHVAIALRRPNLSMMLLLMAMALMAFADLWYNYAAARGYFQDIDLPWMASMLLVPLAAAAPVAAGLLRPAKSADDPSVHGGASTLTVGALLVTTAVMVESFLDGHASVQWLASIGVVVVLLLLWRTQRLIRDQRRRTTDLIALAAGEAAARARAEAADREKGRFLATMSHELRTPMHAIIAAGEILAESPLTHEQRTYVDTITTGSDALLTVINDILDLSRLDAGAVDIEQVAFSPRDLMDGVMRLTQAAADQKALGFELHVAASVPASVVGDPHRTRQIVLNLVANAIKFTDTGSVTLTLAASGGEPGDSTELTITIDDTGSGVSPEQAAQLFQPFSQGGVSVERRFGGSGLGLAISRRLADLMGGTVALTSPGAHGVGSTLTVVLPMVVARAEAATGDAHAEAPDKKGPGLRVLLAEDNPVNQQLMVALLLQLGHRATVAADGAQAVAAATTQPFDIVFMDMLMPVMDGVEATRQMIAALGDGHPPVVALTANATTESQHECLAAGMVGFLTKPMRRATLHAAIQQFARPHPRPT